MNNESNDSAFVSIYHFFKEATVPGKVVYQLPSRRPFTLDVVIEGTATVRVYRNNLTDDPTKAAFWGEPVATYTASAKKVIENEPWDQWMVEIVSVTGKVSVAVGG